MPNDFYCDEVLSGRTPVEKILDTPNVMAFHHTRPSYPVHIVVIPKRHIDSLAAIDDSDTALMIDMLNGIREIVTGVMAEHAGCRVITNLGKYQDSKHLHWHIISGDMFKRDE